MNEASVTHSAKYQYIAVLIANLISICHGIAIGWLSPNIEKLRTGESPLTSGPLTLPQMSWLGSSFSLGAVIGNCLFGVLSTYIGRKHTLCILAVPNLTFWVMVLNGTEILELYVGRVFAGITGGGLYICLPIFVAEIAEPRIRGRLASLLMLSVCTGILIGFSTVPYLSYYLVPKVFAPLPILFFVAFIFLPETPQYFISRLDFDKAVKSLVFYRNCRCKSAMDCPCVNAEYNEILQSFNETNALNKKHRQNIFQNVFKWNAIRAILIGISLTALNLFSGTFAMINYTHSIFEQSGSSIDPHMSSVVVGAIQIVGILGSTNLIDRLGRKTLLIISTLGAFFGLATLGTYSYLNESGLDVHAYSWIPLISFSAFIFISCFGILPLPFVVLTEILPAEVRSVGATICMLSNSVFAFISLKMFPILMHELKLSGVSWICAGVCFAGILFSIFVLEETKGKNLNKSASKTPASNA